MKENSIVRENLMTEKDYTPYCGHDRCLFRMPRTKWSALKQQFTCTCGWVSSFPKDFIERYKKKWKIK